MNKRMDRSDFFDMQMAHYENVWDMGVRDLSFPRYPIEYITWQGKRVIICEYSNQVILFEACEFCGNTQLDKRECCTTCSAPVEL